MSTTLQPTEVDRLHALAKFDLLDTAPEPEFERITAHAARIFQVPMALVSLVDAHRQWFKSHHGTTLCETPRDQAFCAHTILENRPLIVPDATLDARFAGHPGKAAPGPHCRARKGSDPNGTKISRILDVFGW